MIITRIPLRISIGGGGTDLPSYYGQFQGHLISAAINKYIYVFINRSSTSNKTKLYYDKVEIIDHENIDDIKHEIIRESFRLYDVKEPLEIGSMSDIEPGTGMGSSSSFTVGLMAGLSAIYRSRQDTETFASDACCVEIDMVGKKIGKQDQYIAAYGGIQEMDIGEDGGVYIRPLKLRHDFISELEHRILLFYINNKRQINSVLYQQSDDIASGNKTVISQMHKIKILGYEIQDALLEENIDKFGTLMNEHWEVKRGVSNAMSSREIDANYELAMKSGALGGKLIGGGGAGFLMLLCKDGHRKQLIRQMEQAGLRFMDFRFDFDGVKVMMNA
jgi:D-glycero-alpha-D-manno-heptose-7-phosphate kinase